MGKQKKELQKPKSRKSTKKTAARIQQNHKIINKLLAEINDHS